MALYIITTHLNGHTEKAWPSYQTIADATGKSVKTIELGCADCMTFSPHGLRLVPIAGGKLVQFGGTLALIDPVAMTIEKQIKWPACPEPKR